MSRLLELVCWRLLIQREPHRWGKGMGMPKLLLGIDIGTSSVKGIICDSEGHLVAQAAREHVLHSPQPGWAEESPAGWWESTCEVVRECLSHPAVQSDQIAGVGVTGMVPAVVLLDQDGQPLRPSIQQNDARAIAEIEELRGRVAPQRFFETTGASLSQQSVGPKLLWIQRHEPAIWECTRTILGSYDYVNYCLTGYRAVEVNWALESGLYNLHTQTWSDDLLAAAHVTSDRLPPIRRPTEIIGGVSRAASALTGLRAGTPVVAGTADHVGAALAAGIREDGDLLIKFGSAGDVLYSTQTLVVDPRLYIDYHDIPGQYLLNGCMATSGSLLKWLVQQFFQDDATAAADHHQTLYQFLDAQAEKLPAGSDGLVVLPYFLGEKTPILDPLARGVVVGLTLYHTRYHLYRAVLEGVVFGFRHHVEVLRERGQFPRRVVASEGGAASRLWRQIAADVLNLPVLYLANNPGASLAAAFVAGIGVGVFDTWDAIDRFLSIEDTTHPDATRSAVYDQLFGLYCQLYPQLKGLFPLLRGA